MIWPTARPLWTSLGPWKFAPTQSTDFWRDKDALHTLTLTKASSTALYRASGEEYRLPIEELPGSNADTWNQSIVGNWARLFYQGSVRRVPRYQLSFFADSTAAYGSYDPKLKASWRVENNRLQIDYEYGARGRDHASKRRPGRFQP